MPNPPHPYVALLIAALFGAAANAAQWLELSPEDLAATECLADPSAGAEVLYKRIEIDQADFTHRYKNYYIRLKVYKEGEVDRLSRITIYHPSIESVGNLHARVVKPDGSESVLDRADVLRERVRSKDNDSLYKTSFSLPQVAPGDIVEYQYSLHMDDGYYTPGLYITFQERWPIRKVEVRAKPFTYGKAGFKWITMHCDARGMKRGRNDFYEMIMTDLPAYPDEPHQPPERDGKAWLQFFTVESTKTGDAFWKDVSRDLMSDTNKYAKPTSTIQDKVDTLLAGVKGQDAKLKVLHDYCRTELINARHCEPGDLTEDDRKKIEDISTATKTLDLGYGSHYDINSVFCAMAQAAGFDARIAAVSNRSRSKFSMSVESKSLALNYHVVAVKQGEGWLFCDPGAKFLPMGELSWRQENCVAFIAEKKDKLFAQTPANPLEEPTVHNRADFELHEDGSLTGSVEVVFSGNANAELKTGLIRLSEEERQKGLRESIVDQLHDATVTNLEIENIAEAIKPAVVRFDLSIPRYADKIGDRLFFQPSVFRKFEHPQFSAQERVSDVFFNFRTNEIDELTIKLPDGYELEEPSAPRSFDVPNLLSYQAKISINPKTHSLIYARSEELAGVFYPVKAYPVLKKIYDEKHRQDQHALTLKRSSPSGDEQSNAKAETAAPNA